MFIKTSEWRGGGWGVELCELTVIVPVQSLITNVLFSLYISYIFTYHHEGSQGF